MRDESDNPLPTLTSEEQARNPWWSYRVDTYRLPDGRVGEYHYARTSGSVLVIPRRDDGTTVMVRQYRYLDGAWGLELPGGGIGAHGSAREAAVAELAEEVGLAASRLESVGRFSPCKGLVQEVCEVFLATGLREVTARPEPTELLAVVELSEAALHAAITAGEVVDGMTLAALVLGRRV